MTDTQFFGANFHNPTLAVLLHDAEPSVLQEGLLVADHVGVLQIPQNRSLMQSVLFLLLGTSADVDLERIFKPRLRFAFRVIIDQGPVRTGSEILKKLVGSSCEDGHGPLIPSS